MSNIEDLSLSDTEENYATQPSEVYLGFVDAAIKQSDNVSTEDTFIGGEPVWLHPDSVPKEELLKCGACQSSAYMKLLLQAFAPLDPELAKKVSENNNISSTHRSINPDDARVMYVFLCTKCPRKSNSIRCVRGVKKSSMNRTLEGKMKSLVAEKDFKISTAELKQSLENPFASTTSESTDANPFSKAAENPFGKLEEKVEEKKTIPVETTNAKAARKQHDTLPDKNFDKGYPGFFLYVEEESFKNKTPDHLKLPENLKIDKTALDLSIEDEDSFGSSSITLDPRTEKLSKFLDDDVFQKFQEVAGYNPLQVLRYDFGGRPLYYAATNVDLEKIVPSPGYNPSSKRVFEMQLMPKMILDLEETVLETGGMEWGTILVFSDLENYTPQFDEHGVGYVEECVRVQWESNKC
ncbi:LANO_0G15588g1_1 [Lachancea nothofagi CBS 11611]|uniref:LANO_0G15588g1_1 n=1 Tax=Lachancea nothofagi CBS 11611 TaxID=1266666 RepID=A0A1G4KK83_9SACH|nr:LANO_0G15588g1_1 [Lachancea nothofagi CBS 11611]